MAAWDVNPPEKIGDRYTPCNTACLSLPAFAGHRDSGAPGGPIRWGWHPLIAEMHTKWIIQPILMNLTQYLGP
ncbi:hypothetical protein BOA8489_03685 [Boseongicola aestuarii]|uniref:Uncharacterized protein n=1 Tax=Boseongicola aestuarii TaxID=1470561 RepID=A0A238J5B8_9RHOB|nr:hypothetical protein BOA8489_03685 [Boseongicola aestuarii]